MAGVWVRWRRNIFGRDRNCLGHALHNNSRFYITITVKLLLVIGLHYRVTFSHVDGWNTYDQTHRLNSVFKHTLHDNIVSHVIIPTELDLLQRHNWFETNDDRR